MPQDQDDDCRQDQFGIDTIKFSPRVDLDDYRRQHKEENIFAQKERWPSSFGHSNPKSSRDLEPGRAPPIHRKIIDTDRRNDDGKLYPYSRSSDTGSSRGSKKRFVEYSRDQLASRLKPSVAANSELTKIGSKDDYDISLPIPTLGDGSILQSSDEQDYLPRSQSVMSEIEYQVLCGLGSPAIHNHHATFVVAWDILNFMKTQYVDAYCAYEPLRSVITLSGSSLSAQATPSGIYMQQDWPTSRPQLLESLQNALDDPLHKSSGG